MSEPPETYTLTEVARLFRQDYRDIKIRAAKGEFEYTIDERGHYRFTRESILQHLEELQIRNNRI